MEALTIIDPHLKKRSEDDKLSIMDLRAQLDDGTTVLIEMHLYDLIDLKYKTIRSWARVYGEELKAGNAYLTQPPVICVAFAGGSLDGVKSKKVHKCCMITDIDDHTVFTDALQLHYINMKAFVESVNQKGGIRNSETPDTMLQKWLTVITQNEIADKTIIQNICEQEEEIGMVVSE
ncbi:MAG: Rpn family recombination-promoting nuclease/putative transposase, partial [Clostridiales bacterium]|nr:Rpn family recombination-promoting nuclease/putative transposase [Clostridiales bacterium]